MTKTAGIKGFGSTVKWNGTAIAYCRDIPWPSMNREKVDFTNQDSPDEAEEFVMGMLKAGEVQLELVFIPGNASQQAAITDFLAGTMREMIITGPTSNPFTWTCEAGVTDLGGSLPYKGEGKMTVKLALSGKPVLGVTFSDDLSALTITTATLVPSLTASVYTYTANTTGTSVTVTPTCAGATSIEVWLEGVLISTLSSGGTSSACAIAAVGTKSLQVKVKTTNKATRVYNIQLTKTA